MLTGQKKITNRSVNRVAAQLIIIVPKMAEGPRRHSGHRCSLPLPHWGGKLQLALPLPLRLPGRRGEDRHQPEGEFVLLGRDSEQGAAQAGYAGLGRRLILQGEKHIYMFMLV